MKHLLINMITILAIASTGICQLDVEWIRQFQFDSTMSIQDGQQTSDGGYILTGYNIEGREASGAFVVRTDDHGDTLWTWKSNDKYNTRFLLSIVEAGEGGFLATGLYDANYNSKFWIVRFDDRGDTLWTKKIRLDDIAWASRCRQTPDGGYIIAAENLSNDGGDGLLIRTDSVGDTLWTRPLSLIFGQQANLVILKDYNYVVGGIKKTDDLRTASLVKMNDTGDIVWTQSYSHTDLSSVDLTYDGGLLLIQGTRQDETDKYLGMLTKTDSMGLVEWERDICWSRHWGSQTAFQAADEAYTVAGINHPDSCLEGTTVPHWAISKYDINGVHIGSNTYLDTLSAFEYGVSRVITTSDGGFVLVGRLALMKLGPNYSSVENQFSNISTFLIQDVYPNPFNPLVTIKYEVPEHAQVTLNIYDILGRNIRTLMDEPKVSGYYKTQWNGTDSNGKQVSTGVYFARLQAGEFFSVVKMVFLR